MANATPVLRSRNVAYGGVVEMVVWRVPAPVLPSQHAFKYRLVFVRAGKRIVGYDNERGKGDHRHLFGQESSYRFLDVETLIRDFLVDMEANR